MNHGIFVGEHELVIDEKNRLLIPSEVRRSLIPDRDGNAFYVVIGPNRKPWLYPEKYYEYLVSERKQGLAPNKNVVSFALSHFGMASLVEWDKQWRVLIPDKTLARTTTSKQITLVGAGDHLQIWNREDWEAQFNQLLAQGEQWAADSNPAAQPT